jgi:hypothetical protein
MESAEEAIGSAKPPKPKVRDPERWKLFVLETIAVGTVAAAVFTGITAWETHQDRLNSKTFYCAFASDTGGDPTQERLANELDC